MRAFFAGTRTEAASPASRALADGRPPGRLRSLMGGPSPAPLPHRRPGRTGRRRELTRARGPQRRPHRPVRARHPGRRHHRAHRLRPPRPERQRPGEGGTPSAPFLNAVLDIFNGDTRAHTVALAGALGLSKRKLSELLCSLGIRFLPEVFSRSGTRCAATNAPTLRRPAPASVPGTSRPAQVAAWKAADNTRPRRRHHNTARIRRKSIHLQRGRHDRHDTPAVGSRKPCDGHSVGIIVTDEHGRRPARRPRRPAPVRRRSPGTSTTNTRPPVARPRRGARGDGPDRHRPDRGHRRLARQPVPPWRRPGLHLAHLPCPRHRPPR